MFFRNFGRTPCIERRNIFTSEQGNDVVCTSSESHAQRASREVLQITAGMHAKAGKPRQDIVIQREYSNRKHTHRIGPSARSDDERSILFDGSEACDRSGDARSIGNSHPTRMTHCTNRCLERSRELLFTSVQVSTAADLDPYDVRSGVVCNGRPERERRFGHTLEHCSDGIFLDNADKKLRALRARRGHSLTNTNAERASLGGHKIDLRSPEYVAFGFHRTSGMRNHDGERPFRDRTRAVDASRMAFSLGLFELSRARDLKSDLGHRDAGHSPHVSL